MNKVDEIKKALEMCADAFRCEGCPYDDNFSKCVVRLKEDARSLIIEQEKEIERLKAEFKQLETNAEILARGVRDLNHENYELTEQVKRAKIDVLNKLKTQTHNYYPSIDSYCVSQHVVLVKDIDKMIVEVQNAEDKS